MTAVRQIANARALLKALAVATLGMVVVQTADAQTREYFISVAVNSPNTETHPFTFTYAFGHHPDSGAAATQEAIRACNARRGETCWLLGIPSNRGGCAALVQGSWRDQGEPQQGRLFTDSNSQVRLAQTGAMNRCEVSIFAGKAAGTVEAWDCTPLGSWCSSHVTQ